jgi:putative glutamine amidotransferase
MPEASGELKLTVNSSHHQSVGRPGDGLQIVARSPRDGIIEAVENASAEHFVLGVQWHPERSYHQDACSRAIFAALVEAARQWHERMARGNHDFETATPGL